MHVFRFHSSYYDELICVLILIFSLVLRSHSSDLNFLLSKSTRKHWRYSYKRSLFWYLLVPSGTFAFNFTEFWAFALLPTQAAIGYSTYRMKICIARYNTEPNSNRWTFKSLCTRSEPVGKHLEYCVICDIKISFPRASVWIFSNIRKSVEWQ